MTRFLGMDGDLQMAYDVDLNFVTAWNQMFVNNDFINPGTGKVDPRHMYGSSNFDVFRWPGLEMGIQRSALATFMGALVMPGIPLVGDNIVKRFSRPLKILCSSIMVKSKTFIFSTMAHPTTFTGKCNMSRCGDHRIDFSSSSVVSP